MYTISSGSRGGEARGSWSTPSPVKNSHKKMAAGGSLYFMFLGPFSEISPSATGNDFQI